MQHVVCLVNLPLDYFSFIVYIRFVITHVFVGFKKGRLTAKEALPKVPYKGRKWIFSCECGNELSILAHSVVSGNTSSCGCLRKEQLVARSFKHGNSPRTGWSREYLAWSNMKTRCYNPDNNCYHIYGQRGIIVCSRWKDSFENFLADMGRKPKGTSLDRINGNGNYEPGNCRWATVKQQIDNRSVTLMVTYGGVEKTLVDFCDEFQLPRPRVYSMMHRCRISATEAFTKCMSSKRRFQSAKRKENPKTATSSLTPRYSSPRSLMGDDS